jgi:hypothetical protein
MKKTLLPQQQLIEKINDALPAWEVASLRPADKQTSNWEAEFQPRRRRLPIPEFVAIIEKYEAEYLRAMDELEAKYDVDWSAQIDEA